MPSPQNNLARSIFTTLAYFDIFDFPLTEGEIVRFLHTSQKVSSSQIISLLASFPNKKKGGRIFYFLPEREKNVKERLKNEEISAKKIEKAKEIIPFLRFIPTINFVGISGSLAMLNGDLESDIDLFLITLPNTVWTTRVIVWIIMSFSATMRRREGNGRDTFCVNLILDGNALSFVHKREDIYTAHEIVQVTPVVNKNKTYEFFLQQNNWVLKFLANSFERGNFKYKISLWSKILTICLIPIEYVLRILQLWYMKGHKTVELTTPKIIAFHPYSYRDTILEAFRDKIKI